MSCERCGSTFGEINWSHRDEAELCLRCYQNATPEADRQQSADVEQRHEIGQAIRRAIEPLAGRPVHRQLETLALFIELEPDADAVEVLLGEVEQLGVQVEVTEAA